MIEEWVERGLRLARWSADQVIEIVTSGQSRFHWIYLLSFVATVAAIYVARRVSATPSARGFFSYLFPREIYLTRSAFLDLQLYFVNRIISPIRLFLPFMSAAFVGAYVSGALAGAFGGGEPILPVTWWTTALFTLGLMAMSDLGSYLTHRLHHQIPMLWEFHKVHHSAEVLTPMTPFRAHPVYDVFDLLIRSTLAGGLQGVFAFAVAGEVSVYTVLGANALLAAYYFCGSNVRHSHVWLSWGRSMERFFISPAQHQVHHSCLPQHMNKNYGDTFALWDWMFGSLYVTSHAREDLVIGVGEKQPHSNLWTAYSEPFAACYRMWRQGGVPALLSFERLEQVTAAPAVANSNETLPADDRAA